MESELDLSYLSDKERRRVQAVLERDAQIQKKEEQRLERLKNKAQKTKNPIILKKIRMRSGQWFIDLQLKSKFKKRGVDTVRQSIRLSKSRRGSRVDLSSITPAITPNRGSPAKTHSRQTSSDSRLAPPSQASSISLPPVAEDDIKFKEVKHEDKETNDQVTPEVNVEETPVSTLEKEPDPTETPEIVPEIIPEKPESTKASSESESENNVEEKVAEVVEEIEEKHDDVIITENVDENILEVIEEKVEENEEAVITVEPVVAAASLEDIVEEPEEISESPQVEIEVAEPVAELPRSGSATPKNRVGSTQSLNLLKPKKSTSMLSLASQKSGLFSSCVSQVTGNVKVGLKYDDKKTTLNVNVVSCSELSMVDGKAPTAYVKTYLLPDKAKTSKKKTKVKKKTCDPIYNETLKYKITRSELETRVLNVAVWHDKVGINTFLGEANIYMQDFDEDGPALYDLLPKMDESESGAGWMSDYYGEIEVTMRFQCETSKNILTDSDIGQLDAVIKKVKNVPNQNKSPCNLFIKGYFLPDHHRQTKQKSPVITSSSSDEITFDHLFSYTNVQVSDLKHRCLELRCFHQSKIGKHKLIGGVRIGCGSGMSLNEPVDWMDSNVGERSLWDGCLQTPNTWIEGTLDLRKLPANK